MGSDSKLLQGTSPWLEMVGTSMCAAAAASERSEDSDVSLLERYTDGIALSEGLRQGLRFEISGGRPSFRVGARDDETADIVIEISSVAARTLNLLYSSDPKYPAMVEHFLRIGEMRVVGNLDRLGNWLNTVHDAIVDRTA